MTAQVRVSENDFSVDIENQRLLKLSNGIGAIANFVGVVRDNATENALKSMELEHYPGMTERSIQDVVQRAGQRWSLLGISVIHRIGRLSPGDQIVYVGVASAHRQSAFDGCGFIMDYLKTEAPFWKKETLDSGESYWVSARDDDQHAVQKWQS
ncbi:MAG: molybdenum cofactor biosynthesis protein MoaE [Pseudomonadota bacterium]